MSTKSEDSSPAELMTPSPTEILMEPSILSNNVPISGLIHGHKCSIHHQDAEATIADATDCLRMISGKVNWFHRKQQFCPNLVSTDDARQIALLHQKILIEEAPFLEFQNRLHNGLNVDIPREMEGRISSVCHLFHELKMRIDNLINNITLLSPVSTSPIHQTTQTELAAGLVK